MRPLKSFPRNTSSIVMLLMEFVIGALTGTLALTAPLRSNAGVW